ncbi:HSPA (heat shock 70kDa) binding protein, cytoplasmic cochaperone 1 [Seminavis robusta]|uniref:HSPA (Heat shock 70kDa) binding protein, cytoplasmic cochaperone 1 n=1 Tax=Seminavis robusta TaxID=568900 RepID=A0A9N8DAN3_9STRA|nr:HSPA (heat shock 70kDa) binding protein, cytoplasmic cochaperone 1 [Seminavis robusta]|eukprot:Sro17_g012450.1 HSPA (heat shock 70kDa) binding protein, cytoplasmic cochaperone 1 (362) ;mRNA; r:110547-111632
MSNTEGGGNTPWGWLGLLKWSLAYQDGTTPSSHSPMSEEDKAFLEKVMKEGIIDENERMKEILQQVTTGLEDIRQQKEEAQVDDDIDMQDLLQELRDIVEQIDYARAFAAMKGLDFLLGAVAQPEVPRSIQTSCLGVLATMASNNPPIQKELLEMGAIKTLSQVFQSTPADQFAFRAKIIQALSGAVRSDELSEQVFCGVDQAKEIIYEGLQQSTAAGNSSAVLQKRTLFFLRALITSDDSTRERVRLFGHSVAYVADQLVTATSEDTTAEIREMGLELLLQILEQKKSVNIVLDRKDNLVAHGVKRVQTLRALEGDERDYAAVELETWEALLVQLARATPDPPEESPLTIEGATPEVEPQ